MSMPAEVTGQRVEAAVGLGSNLGDRLAHLRDARNRLAHLPETRLLACSPVSETEPVDVPDAYRALEFLNAVLIFETSLTADAWSAALHGIEDALWRVRTGERNAPRTIDIDLLTFGRLALARPDLTLPHPQCTRRRFVCQPLADLRPDLLLPGEVRPLRDILETLPVRPAVRRVAGNW